MAKEEEREATATPAPWPMVEPGSRGSRGTKKKVSLTIDELVLEEIQALAGDRPVSAVVNEMLERALPQYRLKQLVDEMIAEAGEPPPEAYQRVIDQWEKGIDQWEKGQG